MLLSMTFWLATRSQSLSVGIVSGVWLTAFPLVVTCV